MWFVHACLLKASDTACAPTSLADLAELVAAWLLTIAAVGAGLLGLAWLGSG